MREKRDFGNEKAFCALCEMIEKCEGVEAKIG